MNNPDAKGFCGCIVIIAVICAVLSMFAVTVTVKIMEWAF